MPSRGTWPLLALGAVLGILLGLAVGWGYWGRRATRMSARLESLQSSAAQVQGERERLRRELADIVRERREMAATAEHLRAQVDAQLQRLEALSADLAPPPGEGEPPASPGQ